MTLINYASSICFSAIAIRHRWHTLTMPGPHHRRTWTTPTAMPPQPDPVHQWAPKPKMSRNERKVASREAGREAEMNRNAAMQAKTDRKEIEDSSDGSDGNMYGPPQKESSDINFWRDCLCGFRRLWKEDKCCICGDMSYFPAGKLDMVHGLAGYMNKEAEDAARFIGIEQAKKKTACVYRH